MIACETGDVVLVLLPLTSKPQPDEATAIERWRAGLDRIAGGSLS
jgi:hypothetical protein